MIAQLSLTPNRCAADRRELPPSIAPLNEPDYVEYRPDQVRELAVDPEGGLYQSLYPQDALFHETTLIAQGLLKCVELKGLPIQNGRASIDDISFRLISVYAAA